MLSMYVSELVSFNNYIYMGIVNHTCYIHTDVDIKAWKDSEIISAISQAGERLGSR